MWGKLRSIGRRRSSQSSNGQSRSSSPAETERRKRSGVIDASHETTQRPTHRDALSKYRGNLAVTSQTRQRSQERKTDPLGLVTLYIPEVSPSTDIIFVHGLGGTSQQTWSRNQDPDLFWPQKWLPFEPDICTSRIFSFGYNADFSSTGPNSIASISDFAKSLLFAMKFGKGESSDDLKIGSLPIIFVAHSMGGLVFKKAYLQGQSNDDYRSIVAQIRGVLFLSTPHRGTDLAKMLNRILSVSIFTNHAPKHYLAELNRNSLTLEDLNETFRNFASKLQIFSFYETLQTSTGPKSLVILEKDSSILGYPGEISQPLNANHHDVCKYSGRDDPNYMTVRSVLTTLVSPFCKADEKAHNERFVAKGQKIEALLGISDPPSNDLSSLRDRWMPGTCKGILLDVNFQKWTEDTRTSNMLWIYARPGNGKSVQAAFLVDHFTELGCKCNYYFFKHDDSTKRSASSLLKSLAFQIAQDTPAFEEALSIMSEDSLRFEKLDARSIWNKLFLSVLLKMDDIGPLYWVIDALDESDSISTVVEILSTLSSSYFPIHIIIFSRQTPAITKAFDRIFNVIPLTTMNAERNLEDIRLYVINEMKYMHGNDEFRKEIIDQIVERAEGSFLWVDLVLKEIMQCHSYEEIKVAFDEIPSGMDSLYRRMETSIKNLTRVSDKDLARTILIWATYSRRPLSTDELLRALQPQFPALLDLRFTISKVCGHFVMIDSNNQIRLVHQTARDYLTKSSDLPFSIISHDAHEDLFNKTISIFLDRKIRSIAAQKPIIPFYVYSATSWAYHLSLSPASSDACLTLLTRFFEGPHVLSWIHMLAVLGQLKVLIFTAQGLTTYVQKRRKTNASKIPLLHRLSDLHLLELWTIDLLKLAGRFGGHLLQEPTAIYKYIPQLSPRNSALYQQFGSSKVSPVSVTGLSDSDWDDCLTRVSVGNEYQALMAICSGRYLAVFSSAGIVHIWNSLTFEKLCTFSHEEYLFTMCFSHKGDMLASYGFLTTRVWSIPSQHQLFNIPNLTGIRPLCVTFTKNDAAILMGSDLRNIREISMKNVDDGWQECEISRSSEETPLKGTFSNAPTSMAINGDATEIAIAYRGSPLTVWALTKPKCISKCKRRLGHDKNPGHAWTGVNRILWHPNSGELLGIYTDGAVFKWHPLEESHHEIATNSRASPSELDCSLNGMVFATSDVNGAVRIYNYEHFALIYQLSSEDVVTGLCFSPDIRRFYDLRGSYCNAWEPNVLIRMSNMDEAISEIDTEVGSTTMSYLASEVWAESRSPITAVSARWQGRLILAGSDEGLVGLHDIIDRKKLVVGESAAEMGIDHVVWDEAGRHIAYAELGGRIVISRVVQLDGKSKSEFGWSCELVMSFKVSVENGGISQILFSPDSSCLLVASLNSAQLWSLESKSIRTVYKSPTPGVEYKWVTHTSDKDNILVISAKTVTVLGWTDLKERGWWKFRLPASDAARKKPMEHRQSLSIRHSSSGNPMSHLEPLEVENVIDQIIATPNSPYILICLSQRSSQNSQNHRSRFHLIEPKSLKPTTAETSLSIDTTFPIPNSIAATIEKPLTLLGEDLLVYLDKSFWVCSYRIINKTNQSRPGTEHEHEHEREYGDDATKARRHFFLPRDWVDAESLKLCRVMADGTLLCPRKGEVAVIRSDLGSEW